MKKIDVVELDVKINGYLKQGIRLQDLTIEKKLEIYKDIYGEDVELVSTKEFLDNGN